MNKEQEDLKRRLKKILNKNNGSKATVSALNTSTNKESGDFLFKAVTFFCCMSIIFSIGYFAYNVYGEKIRDLIVLEKSIKEIIPKEETIKVPSYVSEKEFSTFVAGLKDKLKVHEEYDRDIGNKIWMLSLAVNENANIAKSSDAKKGITNSEYIVFGHDWKLSKMPKTMTLTEEQKKKLSEFVKK